MVAVPLASPSVAPLGLERVKVNASALSGRVSPITGMATVFEVSPAAKLIWPLVAT
jgi:hypothetical protein